MPVENWVSAVDLPVVVTSEEAEDLREPVEGVVLETADVFRWACCSELTEELSSESASLDTVCWENVSKGWVEASYSKFIVNN